MHWSEMKNNVHKRYHFGFPTDSSMESLFPYHNNRAGISWRQIFLDQGFDQLVKKESDVSKFYKFTARKLDKNKRRLFGRHSIPPTFEEFVSEILAERRKNNR